MEHPTKGPAGPLFRNPRRTLQSAPQTDKPTTKAANLEQLAGTAPAGGAYAVMAHFYFHLRNDIGLTRDDEGQELPDLAAAREYAIDNIRSVLGGEAREGRIDLRGSIEIADGGGSVLAVVSFSEAVDLQTGSDSP
jgi:hypothetical protein